MPKVQLEVLCPQSNCRHRQLDRGQGQTCDKCGVSPLPSYAYPRSSSFHPDNCNGGITQPKLNSDIVTRTQPKSFKDLLK